jgi:hypothetical protein
MPVRACQRIGLLSADMPKAERSRTDLRPTSGMQTKTATLAEAGISTSAANRYEIIAGGHGTQRDADRAGSRLPASLRLPATRD